MAFTFQINNNIRFNHDEKLLENANKFKPKIFERKVVPLQLVDIVLDDAKLDSCGIKNSSMDITKLSDYQLKRNDKIILDFGEHLVGQFSIDIDQEGSPMDAPLYVRFRFAEMPNELLVDSTNYDGWLSKSWIQEEFVHLDILPTSIALPRRYSFRFVEITVIDTSPKWAAVFSNPVVKALTSADYSKLESVQIEDDELRQIYNVGVKTLSECMQDVFEDGPKRDRRLWLGDLRLQALANYATFNQVDIVKRCLYLFAGMTTESGKISANVFVQPTLKPDDTFLYEYSLFFISVLYDFYCAQNDLTLVKELYPIAKKQMDISLAMVDSSGKLLVSEDYPVFVDWSNDFNKDSAGQAETIYVLKQFIELAQLVQDDDISKYINQLNLMVAYSLDYLYDKKRRLFVTNNNEYNIATQVWFVLAGILSDSENKQLMEETIKQLFPVKGIATPYMYHHIVEALFVAGLNDEAIEMLKKYWGKMIDLGADTFWEAFDPDNHHFSPYGSPIVNSYCHAWSCTPVYLIKKYILNK